MDPPHPILPMPVRRPVPYSGTYTTRAVDTTQQTPNVTPSSASGSIARDTLPVSPVPQLKPPLAWHRIFRKSIKEDLHDDLSVKRLNKIHKHLWWVGRPGNVNTLHRQKTMLRTIVITEKPLLHLVWFDFTIFIKPLPEYLLDWEFFNENICKSNDEELYGLACGFLLSYSKLILYKSDHKIAVEEGLIPGEIDWPTWCKLSADIRKITVHDVNKRYRYGELRLGRLNQIYRFCKGQPRGYYTVHTKYNHFFQKNFGWLLLLFAFLTIILTGMQVVLATPQTGASAENKSLFEDVSYVFGVISIVIVVIGSFIALLLFLVLFLWNLVVTLIHRNNCRRKRLRGKSIREKADLEAAKSS